MKKPLYCVTGISRLTRDRVRLTPPCSRETAIRICKREMDKPPYQRDYLMLQAQPYHDNTGKD